MNPPPSASLRSALGGRAAESVEVPADLRADVGVEHRGAEPLVLAELR